MSLAGVSLICGAADAVAERAVLRNGNTLRITGYRLEGEWITLLLGRGGEIALPAGQVLEIRGEPAGPSGGDGGWRLADTEPGGTAPSAARAAAAGPSPDPAAAAGPDPASPPERAGLVELASRVARRHDVDEDLVLAVIEVESNFDAQARSPRGAAGLMQLMPRTAARFSVSDPYDPEENLRGGVLYLKELLDRYSGQVRLAVAAYNAGEEAVERFNGIPPYRETIRYVGRVMGRIGR
ncbi:MAG: lytic transglycosylase domain-containing protein [Acidobacteriota bacterium]